MGNRSTTGALLQEAIDLAEGGRLGAARDVLAACDCEHDAAALFTRANVETLLGEDERAAELFRSAAQRYRASSESRTELARCLASSAHALASAGAAGEARAALAEAREIFGELGDAEGMELVETIDAQVAVATGEYERLLEAAKAADNGPGTVAAIADALRASGWPDKALRLYGELLDGATLDANARARVLAGAASAREAGASGLPGLRGALRDWLEAAEAVDEALATAGYHESSMGAYRRRLPDAWANAARCAATDPNLSAAAFEYAERGRSARLRELWGAAAEPATAAQVAGCLEPAEIMVSLVTVESSSATRGDVVVMTLDSTGRVRCAVRHGARRVTHSALGTLSAHAVASIERRRNLPLSWTPDLTTGLRQLGEVLLGGVWRDALGASGRITFVPHGELHAVPFAALLVDGGTYLVEERDVAVIPQASLRGCRDRVAALAPNRVAFVDAQALAGAGRVRQLLEGRAGARVEAAESFFSAVGLDRATEAYFYTHGSFDEAHPDDSGLLLRGPGEPPVSDELAGRLRGLELVAAIACSSGSVAVARGEAMMGLTPKLLAVSSQAVACLWPVWEDQAAEFLEAFVPAWDESKDVGRAVSSAQRALLASPAGAGSEHPLAWGGFCGLG